MKSIAKPGSFGSLRSATDERFTKNWLIDCAKLDGTNRAASRKPRKRDLVDFTGQRQYVIFSGTAKSALIQCLYYE